MNLKPAFFSKIFLTCIIFITIVHPGFAQFGGIGGMNGFNQRSAANMQKAYQKGRENGQQMRGYLGYEVGVFFSFADRNYTHVFDNVDFNGYNRGPASIKLKLKSRMLGFNAGTYTILAKLGATSAIAFDWGVTGIYSHSTTGDIIMPSGSKYLYSINYMQLGAPLLLDYKIGGEACYDKAEALSVTLGAGLQPALSFLALGSSTTTKGILVPMVKAELGFFAGIQWKIKASYVYQSGNLHRAVGGSSGLESAPETSVYTISTTAPVNIGISFMPFSFDWENSRW